MKQLKLWKEMPAILQGILGEDIKVRVGERNITQFIHMGINGDIKYNLILVICVLN